MMYQRSKHLVRAIAVLATAGIALGACSSDSNEAETTTVAPTETTASPAKAETIVEIAAGNSDFTTLVAAVKAADLAGTLSGEGPFTVFAPTNAAFDKLPAGTVETLLKPENKQQLADILTYHAVAGKVLASDVKPGDVTTVNGATFTISIEGSDVIITDGQGNKAKVVKTDIIGSNGVIHVIDTVLMPPKSETIVEIAAGNSDFMTLVAAVKAAGLADTLSGEGPFTVFAPTNAAFDKLPAGTVETLLKPENKQQLADILTYHAVAGKVLASDVKPGDVTTVNGATFTISIEGSDVIITDGQGNKAKVVKTDIVGSNGVIHVIDTVLMPPAK